MSVSDVAAVCSMILDGITVTDFGVSTRGAVNLLDEGSATRLASIRTPATSVLSGAVAAAAVAMGASASETGAAATVRARPRPARPATAATPRARRGRLTTPAKFGLRIITLSPRAGRMALSEIARRSYRSCNAIAMIIVLKIIRRRENRRSGRGSSKAEGKGPALHSPRPGCYGSAVRATGVRREAALGKRGSRSAVRLGAPPDTVKIAEPRPCPKPRPGSLSSSSAWAWP